MKSKEGDGKLSRELSLFQVTVAGVGIILGAGIYALIGVAAGTTGNSVWLAFLIAAAVAALTGLSYAELSSIFRGDAGEYDYVTAAFNKRIGFIIGLLVILSGFFGAATVAIGFGSYLSNLLELPIIYYAAFLILVCSIINYAGIRSSARVIIAFTFIEAAGLLIIILLGLRRLGDINYFEMPNGVTGLFETAALVFFAYIGFETIVKLSEEAKNPAKAIPKAIVYSLILTTIIYALVSISAVSILDWQKLSSSTAPLADAAAVSFGSAAFLALAIIALFSTSNTVLMLVVTTSRMVYGMAERRVFPGFLARVDERFKTPIYSILMTCLISIILLSIKNLETVAYLTNFSLFVTFALINLSVIVLRYKSKAKRAFKVPLNIGNFPVLAALGFFSCIVMLVFAVSGIS